MRKLNSFFSLWSTTLVLGTFSGRGADLDNAAQAKAREAVGQANASPIQLASEGITLAEDTEAQAKARQALRERERDWGAKPQPDQNQNSPASQASETKTSQPAPVDAKSQNDAQSKAQDALRQQLGQAPAQPGVSGTNVDQGADFRRVPMIRGIVIIGSLKEFNPDGVPLKPGLSVTNNPLLLRSDFAQISNRYLGRSMDEARMRQLQREIILFYRANDRPLVDVLYPEQDVSNGMLQVIVIEGRLKEVRVQDKHGNPYTNGWTGLKFMHDAIRLQPGDVISAKRLGRDLDWLNQNPFRSVEALYEPDRREYGSSSVLLRVDEQRQWSTDFGYENTGSIPTSENRLIAGFTWGKAFGLQDNQFRYAFTFDPSFQHLLANSVSYYLPLPWRHGIRISGYYLDVNGDLGGGSTLKGSAWQASVRYEVPLPTIKRFQQVASLGFDIKYNENNLLFNQVSYYNTPTEIYQLAGGYTAVLPDPWGQTSVSLLGYYSPGGVNNLNSDEAFLNTGRTDISAKYTYGRFSLERTTFLPGNFSWIVRGSAQLSDGPLLASEQLGMGGYATVRGYEEREGNGDQGFLVSTELRTPPLSLIHMFTSKFSLDDKFALLAFWDYGMVHNLSPFNAAHYWFSGVGPGFRYTIARNFSMRLDYGWQLLDPGLGPPDAHGRVHVGIVATY